jgi:hypothetical protein
MAKLAALLVVLGLLAFWAYTAHETATAEHALAAIAAPLAERQVGIGARVSGRRYSASTATSDTSGSLTACTPRNTRT